MKKYILKIYHASCEVLGHKNYVLLFSLISFFMLSFQVLLPVYSIAGNDLSFQLTIFTIGDWFLIIPISLLVGLMITMQVYSYKKNKRISAGKGITGASSGIIASIFGTASCSSCLAALFGFIGIGNIMILLEYQNYIVVGSMMLILGSIYFTSKKIQCEGICK